AVRALEAGLKARWRAVLQDMESATGPEARLQCSSESPRAAVGAAVPEVAASACDLSSSAAQREEPRAHAPVPSPSEEPRARAPVPSPSPERSPPTPSASQALPERRHSALSAVDPYCRLSDALDFITVRGVVGFRALGEVSAAAAAVAIAVLRLAGSADIGESSVSAAPLKTWEEARRVLLKPGHFVSSLRRYPYAAERGQVLDSDVSAAEETLMEAEVLQVAGITNKFGRGHRGGSEEEAFSMLPRPPKDGPNTDQNCDKAFLGRLRVSRFWAQDGQQTDKPALGVRIASDRISDRSLRLEVARLGEDLAEVHETAAARHRVSELDIELFSYSSGSGRGRLGLAQTSDLAGAGRRSRLACDSGSILLCMASALTLDLRKLKSKESILAEAISSQQWPVQIPDDTGPLPVRRHVNGERSGATSLIVMKFLGVAAVAASVSLLNVAEASDRSSASDFPKILCSILACARKIPANQSRSNPALKFRFSGGQDLCGQGSSGPASVNGNFKTNRRKMDAAPSAPEPTADDGEDPSWPIPQGAPAAPSPPDMFAHMFEETFADLRRRSLSQVNVIVESSANGPLLGPALSVAVLLAAMYAGYILPAFMYFGSRADQAPAGPVIGVEWGSAVLITFGYLILVFLGVRYMERRSPVQAFIFELMAVYNSVQVLLNLFMVVAILLE
ncbi:unnamed protein product, partial [Polarella glacialis]